MRRKIALISAAALVATAGTVVIANQAFAARATTGLAATASVTGSTIRKVDFYNGTTLLGTDTSSPYSFSWANVAAGNYSVTAKATPAANQTATPPAAAISVTTGGGNN